MVPVLDALTDVGGLVVHQHPALGNQRFHFQARAQAGLGQDFVQFGGFRLGTEHPLERFRGFCGVGLRVKSARDHLVELNTFFVHAWLPGWLSCG